MVVSTVVFLILAAMAALTIRAVYGAARRQHGAGAIGGQAADHSWMFMGSGGGDSGSGSYSGDSDCSDSGSSSDGCDGGGGGDSGGGDGGGGGD